MAEQRSHYTNYGQTFHSTSVLDAMWQDCPHPALLSPVNGFGEINDFIRFAEDQWTITAVEAGTGNSTIAMTDRSGGWVRINTAANENDGAQAQLDGESIILGSTNKLWLDFRIELTDDVTQSDAFVGLATTSTTIIASAPNDYVLWIKDDGDDNWDFVAAKDGTETEKADEHTAVVDTAVVLGIKWDGSTLTPYVDGVAGTAITTNVPDNEALKLSFGYLNGAAAAQNEGMEVDWYRFVNIIDRS